MDAKSLFSSIPLNPFPPGLNVVCHLLPDKSAKGMATKTRENGKHFPWVGPLAAKIAGWKLWRCTMPSCQSVQFIKFGTWGNQKCTGAKEGYLNGFLGLRFSIVLECCVS
jgi:hypothetical protein